MYTVHKKRFNLIVVQRRSEDFVLDKPTTKMSIPPFSSRNTGPLFLQLFFKFRKSRIGLTY